MWADSRGVTHHTRQLALHMACARIQKGVLFGVYNVLTDKVLISKAKRQILPHV